MPKAARRTSGPNAAVNRKQPYAKFSPKSASKTDKENVDPKASSKSRASPKSDEIKIKGDYRDIHLDEVNGEVPYKFPWCDENRVQCNIISPL